MRTLIIKKLVLLFGIVSIAILTSCIEDSDYNKQNSKDDKLIKKHIEDNNIDAIKSNYGFYYTVVEANESGNEIEENDIFSMYYKISTLEGAQIEEVLESSGTPKRMKMTYNSIFPQGILMGSSLMKEGETYRFYLPSNLAYGSYNYNELIPRDAVLIVESKLTTIEDEDAQKEFEKIIIETYISDNNIADISESDSGVFYKKTADGTGDTAPGNNDLIKIKYTAKYLDGNELSKTEDDKTFDFRIGAENVIEGVQESVKLMKKGEKATFIIPSHLAYDASLQVLPEEIREDLLDKGIISNKILPFSNLIFEIELVEIN